MSQEPETQAGRSTTRRITFPVPDVSSDGKGILLLERLLLDISGVKNVYANAFIEMVYVAYDPSLCDVQQLVDTIRHAGFHPGEPCQR